MALKALQDLGVGVAEGVGPHPDEGHPGPRPFQEDLGGAALGAVVAHLERLSFIRHCRALDMPLGDVNRLLGFVDKPDTNCGDVDLLVDDQLARVRARLKSMRALEKQLLRLRARCSGTHEGAHCGILDELVSAAHGESCACHPT